MSAVESVRQWTAGLKGMIGEATHGHLAKTLAALSFAMSLARSCRSLEVAVSLPGSALAASVRRRFERFIANSRLDVTKVYAQLAAAIGERRRGKELVLIVDESDRDDSLRSLRILAAMKHRCLPLLAVAYTPSGWSQRARTQKMNDFLLEQLTLVHSWLEPYDLKVTLLADRGLAWPSVARLCQQFGWHYVLRLQDQTKMRSSDGTESTVRQLLYSKAGRLLRRFARVDGVEVFKKAGWVSDCCVTAVRDKKCKQPWYLLSDLPAGYARVRRYCKRMWCEQSFRDEKSAGVRWRDSRINDPERATRLLLLIALALWLCLLTGLSVVRRGWRRHLDCHRKRLLSYFKIGLLWLQSMLVRPNQPTCPFTLEGL